MVCDLMLLQTVVYVVAASGWGVRDAIPYTRRNSFHGEKWKEKFELFTIECVREYGLTFQLLYFCRYTSRAIH